MKATLTLDQVRTLITMDEVQFVNVTGDPSPAMDVAREISGADYLAGLPPPEVPFTGEGVRGAVLDWGIRETHAAFDLAEQRITVRCEEQVLEAATGHGTRVYGTVFGDGAPNPSINPQGILRDAEGIFFSRSLLGDPFAPPSCRYRDVMARLLVGDVCCPTGDTACPYSAVFQSNSWITLPYRLDYHADTAVLDDIAFTYDILICQSQGNCGHPDYFGECNGLTPQHSGAEAWAKNVVSVGGVKHYNSKCHDDHTWRDGCVGTCDGPCCATMCCEGNSYCCAPSQNPSCCVDPLLCYGGASRGYAEDYRVKPDLVHFFDNVNTTCHADDYCYAHGGTVAKRPFGGTSAATPITCGYAGLIFEMWASDPDGDGVNMFGNTLTSPTCDPQVEDCVFVNRPHAATVKALMINTAYRYPLTQADLDRRKQGWGMVDVERLYSERDKIYVIDETVVLRNLVNTFMNFDVSVSVGLPELRVTLAYSDPPGTPSANRNAQNDLSLKVTSPSGIVYWGTCGLKDGNWSVPAPTCVGPNPPDPDDPGANPVVDTVENVFIQDPEPGMWKIRVDADEINEDGHVEYLNDDPTECCTGNPQCSVDVPKDADFALVVSGVSAVYGACCNGLTGSCTDKTKAACQKRYDGWYSNRTCATIEFCPTIE